MTLEEVIEKTGPLFEKPLEIPVPSLHWKRKLEALEEAGLMRQRAACLFDMRVEQAKAMGFQQMTLEEAVEALMGEPPTDDRVRNDLPRHIVRKFANHHNGEMLVGWGSRPHEWIRSGGFWRREKWRCRSGGIDNLKAEVPYGVVLKLNEVRRIGLFNYVEWAVAPDHAWIASSTDDPILLATVSELPPDPEGKYNGSGREANFFVAQWGDR